MYRPVPARKLIGRQLREGRGAAEKHWPRGAGTGILPCVDALEFRVKDPKLRDIFDEDAELYERARPRYPGALVEELVRVTGAGPGVRVLEIAPGTGKLTVDLAASGCSVTGVEIGPGVGRGRSRVVRVGGLRRADVRRVGRAGPVRAVRPVGRARGGGRLL
ncbi:class I SAM-dependent methyltransferase [Streptomyces sp. NPDC002172]